MARRRFRIWTAPVILAVLSGVACKSVPTASPALTPSAAVMSLDRKIGWILRLEQQRTLRDASVPPVIRTGATPRAASFTPATVPDLEALALDPDAVVRRRALLAIGRIGSIDGVPALVAGLQDADADARASAAFGLGLIGPDAKSGVSALEAVLGDASALVRGRAIEGLGLIGDVSAAPAIVKVSTGCGALIAPILPDAETAPKTPEIEACRLALFALVQLKQYDALAAIALDADGRPVSRWWPVAYALQRINDPRAAPALVSLASSSGIDTVGFALRGLAALKDLRVVPIARMLAANRDADVKLRVAAVRALGQAGGTAALAPLLDLLNGPALPPNLAVEIVTAIGGIGDPSAFDPLVDRLNDASPALRAAALTAAAKVNSDAFLLVLAGLGPDRDWSVRAALADVLATLPANRVTSAIEGLVDDEDARVHGPALEALAAVKAPDLATRLFASLAAPDFVERSTAARLVGEVRPDGGIPQLAAAYARGESDATYAARAAALEALSKYGGDDVKVTLRRGLSDREWPVRWRAAELLRGMGEVGAMPERPAPLRQPNEYFESAALLHPAFSPHAFIETSLGRIEVELNVVDAPITTQTFIGLARSGFFNGMKVHRVVPAFVVQAGDPRGDGEGGPGYTVPDELSPTPFLRGTMGVALDWRDTGGSQWFITLSPQPHLDGKYTVFGKVVDGWDVLDRLSQWDVIDQIRVWDGVEFK